MRDILRITVPLTVWLAAFSAVYGLEGLVCSDRWPWDLAAGRQALALLAAFSLAVQFLLLLALRSRRFASRSGFVQNTSLTLAAVAVIATGWTLLPVVTASLCL